MPVEKAEQIREEKVRGFTLAEIEKIAEEVFAIKKIDGNLVSNFFAVPRSLVTARDVEFFKKYVRLAGQELVRGYILSPERIGIQYFFMKAYLNRMSKTMWNGGAYHDISHTIVDLFRHLSISPIGDLIPKFRKIRRAIDGPFEDEFFNSLWPDFPQRGKIVNDIPQERSNIFKMLAQSKDREDFKKQFMTRAALYMGTPRPETALDFILDEMYDRYVSEPRLMLDMFIHRAEPFVRMYS